jgi:hypothetical protein
MMSDIIQGPPKTVQQSHNLRPVREVKLNEERSDEDRHLAELEERVRNAKRRKPAKGEGAVGKRPSAAEKRVSDDSQPAKNGHIDFTA